MQTSNRQTLEERQLEEIRSLNLSKFRKYFLSFLAVLAIIIGVSVYLYSEEGSKEVAANGTESKGVSSRLYSDNEIKPAPPKIVKKEEPVKEVVVEEKKVEQPPVREVVVKEEVKKSVVKKEITKPAKKVKRSLAYSQRKYDDLFAEVNVPITEIPRGNFPTASLGPALASLIFQGPDAYLNFVLLNLNRYVVAGEKFAEISVDYVKDRSGQNILRSAFSGYDNLGQINLQDDYIKLKALDIKKALPADKTIRDISKIAGDVTFNIPKGVGVIDFVARDEAKKKKAKSGTEFLLSEINKDGFKIEFTGNVDPKNILQVLVYNADSKQIKAKASGVIASSADDPNPKGIIRHKGFGESPKIIRIIYASSFYKEKYPFRINVQ